ncbi:MFS transporter [Rhabdothermincola sediminis]|uniref:MFS transporter n=1 Tax=Rhabdothermincola sediminis TaxID=2751370 RepID=UPI001AA0A921|nr:MFS transporter [Rhabdothermincola sediminis]
MSDEPATTPARRVPRLSRNVYVVSAVSFFQDTASELLYPILPFFVTGVLGAPPAVLGLIEGLADGTASAMKAASGRLADLRHRRPLVAAGYGISALGKALLALAGAWPMVLAARFTDRVGKGLRGPPRDAIIADDTTPANRGRAFGFHRAADTAGAVVGPLIGLGLFELVDGDFRPLLWVAVIPAVLSVTLVFLVRERPHPGLGSRRAWSLRGLPRRYWRVITLIGLFALVNFPDTLLLLRADELGYGFAGVVALYVLYNLAYAVLSYPAGLGSDRRSRRIVFAAGLGLFAVAYLGFGLAGTPGWLWVLFPIYGGYTALTDGISRAWVADLAPADNRGTALGIHAAISGVGLLIAGVWAGLAWGDNGRIPFLISGTVTAILAVILLTARRLFASADLRPRATGVAPSPTRVLPQTPENPC